MRIRRSISLATALASACFAAAMSSAQNAPPTATAPAPAPVDPFQQNLLNRLESADPVERLDAQRELATIASFWQQPDMLEKLAEATTDPQTKAIFTTRAQTLKAAQNENQEIAERDPRDLPPISLNLRDASLADAVEALNKALGLTSLFSTPTRQGGPTFTVAAVNLPFGEVMRTLQKVQPLDFTASSGTILLNPRPATQISAAQVSGPAFVFAGPVSMRRTSNIQLDGAAARTSAITIPLTLLVDPRVNVASFGNILISSITDETGRSLVTGNGGTANATFVAQSNVRSQQISRDITAEPGKSLSVVCEARITVATKLLRTVVADMANSINREVAVGTRKAHIVQFKPSPQNPRSVAVEINFTTPPIPAAPALRADSSRIQLRITSGDGKLIWNIMTGGSVSTTINLGDDPGPHTLTITTVDQSVEIPLRFELKDIPLP